MVVRENGGLREASLPSRTPLSGEKVNKPEELKHELVKIKYIATGVCPKCGKELIRDAEIDTAVCQCSSVVEVKLTIAAILPARLERYFNDLARRFACTSDEAYNACFEVGFDNVPHLLARRSTALKQLRKRLEATQ
jgi:DNA-directed RNA polymerase subunit RPC12/RpoP